MIIVKQDIMKTEKIEIKESIKIDKRKTSKHEI
jgi:hypothetical protein